MKNIILITVFTLAVLATGVAIERFYLSGISNDTQAASSAEVKKPLYWVAPMDKNYRRDGPGKSPMGMDLVPVYEDDTSAEGGIKISPVVENNLGVKTAPVRKEKLLFPVSTIGTVQFDESRVTHVHSRVEGWVERLGVAASGDRVRAGQTLFELYSPELVSSQTEYLAALRSGNTSLVNSAAARLRALGLTKNQVQALNRRRKVAQTIHVVAERDGVVIDLNIRAGMYIQPDTEVLSFGSLDSVWLVGEIFERQAYHVNQGQDVDAQLSAIPGRVWQGTVNYIYPELDAKMRTLQARIRLPNDDHVLKPNMLMNLEIHGQAERATLTIPRQALIKTGFQYRVVTSLGDGRYRSVPVRVGREGGGRVQILEGLSEGDMVVTSAQFLIDSESNIESELQRMDAPASPNEDANTTTKAAERVVTSGTIEQVMSAMGMVKITHEPIPAWDWPTMTMDFPINETLSLDDFTEGETLSFELTKEGDWDYRITAIKDPSAAQSHEHDMDHADPKNLKNSQSAPMPEGDRQ